MDEKKKTKTKNFDILDAFAWILVYTIKALKIILSEIKKTFNSLKKKKTEHDLQTKSNIIKSDLINRLKNHERLNPQCKYADCLISLGSCAMLEKCLIDQINKVKLN